MNRIQELREERNIKQGELSKLLNVVQTSISKYESGKILLKEDQIIDLCHFFNVSSDYLLGLTSIRDINNMEKELLDLLGISKEQYSNLSDNAKKQIKDFIKFVEEQDKK